MKDLEQNREGRMSVKDLEQGREGPGESTTDVEGRAMEREGMLAGP